jgi:haloalkane dehalogenase
MQRCQELVESFRGPAAIVWGDRDPVLGRARGRLERLLPGAAVTRTAGGHFLQEEEPAAIAAAVASVSAAAFGRADPRGPANTNGGPAAAVVRDA